MDQSPEFFIDRSLGRKHLAETLCDLGFTVHTAIFRFAPARRGERP